MNANMYTLKYFPNAIQVKKKKQRNKLFFKLQQTKYKARIFIDWKEEKNKKTSLIGIWFD